MIMYILLFFSPVDRQIVNAKSLPEVGNLPRHSIDDMGDLIADDKLDILSDEVSTLAAS